MLKLLSSSSNLHNRINAFSPVAIRSGSAESAAPILRALSSLTSLNRSRIGRVFFCSDAKDGSEPATEADPPKEVESGSESKSSAIVSTNPRPEDYLTVCSFGFWLNYSLHFCSIAYFCHLDYFLFGLYSFRCSISLRNVICESVGYACSFPIALELRGKFELLSLKMFNLKKIHS